MRYGSKPVEIEAMRWSGYSTREEAAEAIVKWVKRNGGEARYEPATCTQPSPCSATERCARRVCHPDTRIAVRTINGWAYAVPGHYVVMGSTDFTIGVRALGGRAVRDFYPCDPGTFESRWEPLP